MSLYLVSHTVYFGWNAWPPKKRHKSNSKWSNHCNNNFVIGCRSLMRYEEKKTGLWNGNIMGRGSIFTNVAFTFNILLLRIRFDCGWSAISLPIDFMFPFCHCRMELRHTHENRDERSEKKNKRHVLLHKREACLISGLVYHSNDRCAVDNQNANANT